MQPFEHEHEFVAAEAGQGVLLAHMAAQALGHLLQQLVAHIVAEGVVEILEVVQIDEQQGAVQLVASALRQGMLQAVEQQAAVGQAGEQVVEGQAVDLREVLLVLADVGGDAAQGIDAAVGVAQRQLHREVGLFEAAVRAAVDFLGLHPLAEQQHAAIVVVQIGHGGGVEEAFVGLPHHLCQRQAEQLADLAVGVLVTQPGILDVDVGFDAVEDGVQALFAGFQVTGLLGDLAAQQQGAAERRQEQAGQGRQAPPDGAWHQQPGAFAAPALQGLVVIG
ncbi:hypothetical protein FQZ97_703160 [compost metagenome]